MYSVGESFLKTKKDAENRILFVFDGTGIDSGKAYLNRELEDLRLFCSDDLLAVALERICIQMGLSIPDDLSIISFNNSFLAQLTTPQLTSVDVNSLQLGYEAASQIANHADNPNLMASKIIVPHRIVERSSCKAV